MASIVFMSDRSDRRPALWWHALAYATGIGTLIWLDIASKAYARTAFADERSEAIPYLLDFVLHYNDGIAFGTFAGGSELFRLALLLVTTGITLWLMYWLYTAWRQREHWLQALALCLLIGGAIGNLLERYSTGFVTDFLLMRLGDISLFVCNVADIAVSTGVVFLLVSTFVRPLPTEP